MLEAASHTLRIRCLPKDLPAFIDVDVTELHVGKTIHISELKPVSGVVFLGDKNQPVVSCVQPVEEIVEAVVEAAVPAEGVPVEGVPAEGAAAVPGAAPAAGAARCRRRRGRQARRAPKPGAAPGAARGQARRPGCRRVRNPVFPLPGAKPAAPARRADRKAASRQEMTFSRPARAA